MTLSREKQCALSPIPLTQFLRPLMKVHFPSPPNLKRYIQQFTQSLILALFSSSRYQCILFVLWEDKNLMVHPRLPRTVLLILTAVNSLSVFHSYKLRALLTASLTMTGFHPSKLYKSSNVSSHATYCISLYLVLPRSIMHSFFFFDTYIYGTLCAWTACTLFTFIVCFSGLIFFLDCKVLRIINFL